MHAIWAGGAERSCTPHLRVHHGRVPRSLTSGDLWSCTEIPCSVQGLHRVPHGGSGTAVQNESEVEATSQRRSAGRKAMGARRAGATGQQARNCRFAKLHIWQHTAKHEGRGGAEPGGSGEGEGQAGRRGPSWCRAQRGGVPARAGLPNDGPVFSQSETAGWR